MSIHTEITEKLKQLVDIEDIYLFCAILLIDTKTVLSMYGDLIEYDESFIDNYFANMEQVDCVLRDEMPEEYKLTFG